MNKCKQESRRPVYREKTELKIKRGGKEEANRGGKGYGVWRRKGGCGGRITK